MRVAALYDIHGNVAALDAVLAELERELPDGIVVGGDVASGPFPSATLERLMQLSERAHFVRGNADREVVAAYDGRIAFDPEEENPARRGGAWAAQRITRARRDFVATFCERVVLDVDGLGRTLFCHGSPRSDEEMITTLTPESSLRRMLAGVEERVVVCGHTHMQFERVVAGVRVVNAGSVGMAYEGRPGAFWALLGPGVELRRTDYDVERAAEEVRVAGFYDATFADEILLHPPGPDEVAQYFEQLAAERGERA